MKRQIDIFRAQLLVLTLAAAAWCCNCHSAQVGPSHRETRHHPPAEQTASNQPALISALLREQAARQQTTGVASATTSTPTIITTATVAADVYATTDSRLVIDPTRVPSPLSASPFEASLTTLSQPTSTPTTATATTTTATTTTSYQYVKPTQATRCSYNNQTYSVGQKWNDDCLQVCECILTTDTNSVPMSISACRPRCPVYKDPPGSNCTLQRSESDVCCLDWNCELDAKFAPSSATTTIVHTERDQLNVSTTEIKMPHQPITQSQADSVAVSLKPAAAISTTTAATATTTTTTTAIPTTTTATITYLPATITTARSQPSRTTVKPTTSQQTTQRQTPTTTATATATATATTTTTTATTIATSRPTRLTSGEREPKLVEPGVPQILATQSPSSLPPPKPESLVTTISSQPDFFPDGSSGRTSMEPNNSEPSDEVDPALMDLCIQGEDKGFKLNDAWQVEPCNQTCRCVFRTEPRNPFTDVSYYPTMNLKINSAQTEIRCGLPPHCGSVMPKLVPSADCPRPHLLLPQRPLNKCTCPQVTCLPSPSFSSTLKPQQQQQQQQQQPQHQQQQASTANGPPATMRLPPTTTTATTTTTTTTTEAPRGCRSRQQGGRMLVIGETFNDECHSICRCTANGDIRCEQLNCSSEPPADILCAEWMVEQNFRPNSSENKCCPQFVCKRPAFEDPRQTGDRLSTAPSSAPLPSQPSTTPTNAEPESRFKSCLLLGKELPHGERVPEEMQPRGADPCEKACICNDGKIVCQPTCPPVSETPPEDLDCPAASAYLIADECCARWACQIKETFELQDFKITPINSTSAELSFVLPLFAVGQRGSFRLNFTDTPDIDELNPSQFAHWIKRSNISTTDGVFSSQLIKYYQGNLRPNHRYWFQVFVHFENQEPPFDGPIEGPLRSVVMPTKEEPIISTTRPTIMLQPVLSSTPPTRPSSTTNTPIVKTPPSSTTTVAAPPSSTTTSASSASSTTTTTSTTTTQAPFILTSTGITNDPYSMKPDVSMVEPVRPILSPCNHLDQTERQPLPWTDQIHSHMNGPLQRHAWYLLVALSIMTILFTLVSFLYLKKSSRVIAPITSHQSAYDNPTFTKLVSYYANQPHVLLVDESNQNFNNDAILAKQKNLEVDKSSPLNHNNARHPHPHHQHQLNDLHHHNGRQHLI